MTKKRKQETAIPKHDRLCSYWAGCNPFNGLEGNCDCGLSEIESKLEVYSILPESVKSVSVRRDRSKPKEEAKEKPNP